MRLRSILASLALVLPAGLNAQSISFSASVTPFAETPTTFGFTFLTPVTLGTYSSLALEFAMVLALQNTAAGTVAPDGPNGYVLSTYGSLGAGPQVLLGQYGSATCSVSTASPTTSCGDTPSAGVLFTFAPTMFDQLSASLQFEVTGAPRVDISGRVQLGTQLPPTTVPEPASIFLLGTGLLAAGGVAAARRRSRI